MALLRRDDACARIDKALGACAGGTAGLLLVEGAVGCGKTSLLQYAADGAVGRGFTVVRVAAGPAGRDRSLLHRLTAAVSQVDGGAAPSTGHGPGPGRYAGPVDEHSAAFAARLHAACARGPLLLCVDDVQDADQVSLADLLPVVHGLPGAPLLTVLTRLPHHRTDGFSLFTEVLRHPGFDHVLLGRLDADATADLARHWGGPAAPDAAARLYRLSGGNPLLLRALLAEARSAGGGRETLYEPRPGGAFAQAYATCLSRSGSAVRRLALALAVLGPHADACRAARLAGLDADSASLALEALDASGLAVAAQLPHPAAQAVVFAAVSPGDRRALHRDAALLLHDELGEPATVADQLIAAGTASWPWEIQALRDAARDENDPHGDPERAEAFLRLARAGCPDDVTRARIDLQRADHAWRFDPAAAHRRLDEPLAALRAGRLTPADAERLARQLAVQGRVEEADEVLGRSGFPVPAQGCPFAAEATGDPADHTHLAARAAARWLHPRPETEAPAAERLLFHTSLTQATYEPVMHALRTLVQHRPHSAVAWCVRLTERAPVRHAAGWHAALATAHAEALLRLGDLAGARREAGAALGRLTGCGGPFLLAPLAVLVQALTEQGEFAAAAQHLRSAPAGTEPGTTVHALQFLRARGRYDLATQRPEAALEEFYEVGRRAVDWGMDHPGLLPWRTDAAEALLRLGRPAEARALVTEQLSVPEACGTRARGTALRLSAATADSRYRSRLLGDAVGVLRESGDRLELARALADLGFALQMSGEGNRAGTITRRAWQLATDCGAVPLCEQILPSRGPESTAVRTAPNDDSDRLSDAEVRVAAFAAQGYTNREIAAKLFVSVSTVEHHLTRVYRKLDISRRRDLPANLRIGLVESMASDVC
ncbi:LuxR C-terminal-related transcriptional regulator [Streptomyces sp. NPDC026672]|uniref:LuxR C-terminal-related transcriptional regulator n=1 Tax=unclassified Streptomyces TaxID=2593676 RepID=UPI0033F2F05D